jgi:hypothetical protein
VDASSIHHAAVLGWRAVEAQHIAATMLLADSVEEQAILETVLESSKPPIPIEAAGLHWLLFTPFRYPPLPSGSRFRAPYDPGVFYAADERRTACAELGYWRWRFLMDSELDSIEPRQQTLFQTDIQGSCIDLRVAPYLVERDQWIRDTDYAPCQAIAREARSHNVQMVRYESVRDPLAGACLAVLSPTAFAKPEPITSQTWNLHVTRTKVIWRQDTIFRSESFEFSMGA